MSCESRTPGSPEAGAHRSSSCSSSSGSSGVAGSTLVPGSSSDEIEGRRGHLRSGHVPIARLEPVLGRTRSRDVVVVVGVGACDGSSPSEGDALELADAGHPHLVVVGDLDRDVLGCSDHVGLVELVRHASEPPRERVAVAAADGVDDPVVAVERGDADARAGRQPRHLEHHLVGDLLAERRAESGERAVVLVRLERRLQLGADDAAMRPAAWRSRRRSPR